VAEVYELLKPSTAREEASERFGIDNPEPLVCDDEREPPARAQQLQPQLVEVEVKIRTPVVDLITGAEVRLDRD
jgi:hypothetical protein